MKKFILLTLSAVLFFSGCTIINQLKRQIDKASGSPEVSSVSPQDGAKNVALNEKIKIVFNQEMDPSTLNAKGVTIAYADKSLVVYINPFLNSQYDYDANSKTLTITPSQKFVPDQEIKITLTDAVKSKNNKSLPTGGSATGKDRYIFSFTTTKAEGASTDQKSEEQKTATTETKQVYTETMAKTTAIDFLVTKSETYKFDGKAETLQIIRVDKVGCDGCFDVKASFNSKNKGHGNRENQSLSSGDTYHEVYLTIENSEVKEAITDEVFDEINQKEIVK